MSACQRPALRATAIETAMGLARYERHVRRLVDTWVDMELYQTVSSEIDHIRTCCGPLPQVAVPWTALLISHAELVHALWQSMDDPAGARAPAVQARLQEHLACIDVLARRCLRLSTTMESSRRRVG